MNLCTFRGEEMKPSNAVAEYMARCVSNPECRQLNDEEQKVLERVLKDFKRIIEKPVVSPRA